MNETTERRLPASFGPKPGALSRAEISKSLDALTGRFVARAQGLAMNMARGTLFEAVRIEQSLIAMLNAPAPLARKEGAQIIGEYLLDVGEREDPKFWATDLGRAIAREIGWLGPTPSRVIARHVLNVSRQAVDQMVHRGDLDAAPGSQPPGVTRHSLQQAAEKRWPFESDI